VRPSQASGKLRLAHFGTFDVANYGDLLFPALLERRLPGFAVTHVSPVGGAPVWEGCVDSIPTSAAMHREFDAIVVGGGHLIHAQPSDVAPYREAPGEGLFAYADLWLGATIRAAELGVPIAWNAPGVPGPLPQETAKLARWALSQADYVAVRDEPSRRFLRRTGFDGEIHVELDTAIETSTLFGSDELDAAWLDAFAARGLPMPTRALAVHFNARYLGDGIAATAARLDAIGRSAGATPILLALGPCHGDGELARLVAAEMKGPHALIDAPRSLLEIVACIRGAELYVGSSLHGSITACSFGRPSVLVAREAEGGHAKFSGFVDAARLLDDADDALVHPIRFDAWDGAWDRVEQVLAAVSTRGAVRLGREGRLEAALSTHWARLRAALEKRSPADGSRRRAGLRSLESLRESSGRRESAYVGVLLDQARAAAAHREAAQRNARRFRDLQRSLRDAKTSDAPTRPSPSGVRPDREGV
jgi:polysaccharide pyruvyl transferase WcaK-like protein